MPKQNNIHKHGYWLDCYFIGGACDAYENSIRHLKYSRLMAEGKDYGFAVSHIVLGIEEIIKSLILVCLNKDIGFISNDEKSELFRKHGYKHINIKLFFSALSEQSIYEYENYPIDYLITGNNRFVPIAFHLSRAFKLSQFTEEDVDLLSDLMNSANDYKNKGFYVDYNEDWHSPNDIDATVYTKYMDLAIKLGKFIDPIFTLPVTDDRIMALLED